jgi:outer membrane protein OmpA-like peptidoglycan-associated protein
MKYLILLLFALLTFISFNQELTAHVYFNINEAKLTAEAKETLDEFIFKSQNKQVEISGYSDSTGSEDYNLALSKNRAESVAEYLMAKGISKNQLRTLIFKGESTIAPTLEQNRQVTLLVINEDFVQPINRASHLSKTKDGELNQETIDKIEVGDILNVGGLEFYPGRHYLTAYSLPLLDKITAVLTDNPKVKIEIQGHICCQPNGDGLDADTGTRNLSEHRAEFIYLELIKRGVSEDRLTYKGFGASRKLEKEISPEAMQRNRRVSILIIEK